MLPKSLIPMPILEKEVCGTVNLSNTARNKEHGDKEHGHKEHRDKEHGDKEHRNKTIIDRPSELKRNGQKNKVEEANKNIGYEKEVEKRDGKGEGGGEEGSEGGGEEGEWGSERCSEDGGKGETVFVSLDTDRITVKELKVLCFEAGLSTAGKKSDMLARLNALKMR